MVILGKNSRRQTTEKHYESLLQCKRQKVNNGIKAIAAADCIAPDWSVSH